MHTRFFLITAAFAASILFFAGFAFADNSALIAQLQAEIQSLMQQITVLQAQQGKTNSSSSSSSSSSCQNLTAYMLVGSTDATTSGQVSLLQTDLTKEGFDVTADTAGTFGPATKLAVISFQSKYNIKQTGTVGPLTRSKLNSLYGCPTAQTQSSSSANFFNSNASSGSNSSSSSIANFFNPSSGSSSSSSSSSGSQVTCTSFTYSAWGACTSTGTQTQSRTVVTSLPSGCTGGNPILEQFCNNGINIRSITGSQSLSSVGGVYETTTNWVQGQTYTINWSSSLSGTMSIYLTGNPGTNWPTAGTTIAQNISIANDSYDFTVPLTVSPGQYNISAVYNTANGPVIFYYYQMPNITYYGVINVSAAPAPVCTSWTYSDWTNCTNGQQTRQIVSALPAGCAGGNAVLTQSCTISTPNNVMYPNGGESFYTGQNINITWPTTGLMPSDVVRIVIFDYACQNVNANCYNGIGPGQMIGVMGLLPGDTQGYTYTIPLTFVPSSKLKVTVYVSRNSNWYAEYDSAGYFSIAANP